MAKLSEIKITRLKTVDVVGGNVLHVIKKSDQGFSGLGEVYFSYIEPNAVKAWKLHMKMTLNLVVHQGNVRFVFCNPFEDKNYHIEEIGESNYARLTVPPKIWFGFKGISSKPSLIANVANIEHDDSEVQKKEKDDFDYKW